MSVSPSTPFPKRARAAHSSEREAAVVARIWTSHRPQTRGKGRDHSALAKDFRSLDAARVEYLRLFEKRDEHNFKLIQLELLGLPVEGVAGEEGCELSMMWKTVVVADFRSLR